MAKAVENLRFSVIKSGVRQDERCIHNQTFITSTEVF